MRTMLFAAGCCAAALIFFVLFKRAELGQPAAQPPGKQFRVAVLTPATHPSLEKIEAGFRQTCNAAGNGRYAFVTFNANGNKVLLRAQAEEIVNGNFDLVFTIGAGASLLSKELCVKRHKSVPIVFGAVARPVQQGLVGALEQPGGQVTGVVEEPGYAKQLRLLRMLKPQVKRVLLLYNPTQGAGLEEDKQTIASLLNQHNIALVPVEVFNTNEIYSKLKSCIDDVDVVLVLKDHTVVSGIEGVIKLCGLHHVTLLTTDLDSGDKGAALSYGVCEDQFGVQAAGLARKILEDHVSPAELACVRAGEHKIKVNTKTIREQGLELDQEQLFLLSSVIVI